LYMNVDVCLRVRLDVHCIESLNPSIMKCRGAAVGMKARVKVA
jgi:hypothetical protein